MSSPAGTAQRNAASRSPSFPVENVLLVFDGVRVLGNRPAGEECESSEGNVCAAVCVDENSLFETVGRPDGTVLDILLLSDEPAHRSQIAVLTGITLPVL